MSTKKPHAKKRARVVKVLRSHVPDIYPDVIVHDSTLSHIQAKHPEEYGRLEDVYQTVLEPTRVHQSKTDVNSVVLINDTVTSSSGDPLRVPLAIRPVRGKQKAFMKTAYFSSSKSQGTLLWQASDGDDDET